VADLVFLVVVACLYGIALKHPGTACGYVLAGTALEQCAQAFIPLANARDTLCNYLTAGAVIAGLISRILQDRSTLPRLRSSSIWVLGLLAYCYLTAAWSIFPGTTVATLNRSVPYLVTFVGMAPLLVRSERDLRHCLTALLFCSLVALALLLAFAEWGSRGVIMPGKGWETNPLALAEAAGCLLIVTAFAPIRAKLSPPLRHALLAAAVIVTALVFLRTASRGQVVASIAATLLFSLRQRGGGWVVLSIGVGGLLLLALLPEEVARNAQRWDPEQMSDAVDRARIHEVDKLLTFWSHSSVLHQVLGLGHAAAQDPRLLGIYPHVIPAEVLAEEGILGALLFAATIAIGGAAHFRGLGAAGPDSHQVLAATAALFTFEFVLIWKQGSLLGASPFLLLLTLAPERAKTVARAMARDVRSNALAGTRAFARAKLDPRRLRTRAR
jgi:hypothetical protein